MSIDPSILAIGLNTCEKWTSKQAKGSGESEIKDPMGRVSDRQMHKVRDTLDNLVRNNLRYAQGSIPLVVLYFHHHPYWDTYKFRNGHEVMRLATEYSDRFKFLLLCGHTHKARTLGNSGLELWDAGTATGKQNHGGTKARFMEYIVGGYKTKVLSRYVHTVPKGKSAYNRKNVYPASGLLYRPKGNWRIREAAKTLNLSFPLSLRQHLGALRQQLKAEQRAYSKSGSTLL